MKVITICQPFAHLIATGEKRVENRRWHTRHRGPILIHAGKSRDWLDLERDDVTGMVFGAVVAEARLVDCVWIHDALDGPLCVEEVKRRHPWLASHQHAFGPWCWVLDNVERLQEPVPARGKQGLWDLPWPPDGRAA